MAKLNFETIMFNEKGENIKVVLLKYFYFEFPKVEFYVEDGALCADISQTKLENKFNKILITGLNQLTSLLSGKPATYIHQNSGIPLIGHNAFGIVDRNTSMIEIKPMTGCNLNCIFCSVDEGKDSRKVSDFVIEKDYLVNVLRELIEFKDVDDIEINIGPNGEPLLYADIIPLIQDMKKISNISRISMNTNGTLLTKSLIDNLVEAGLTQINISIDALDKEVATKLAGTIYNLEHLKQMAEYAVSKLDVVIAPVWVPGINDGEIPKLIEFGLKIGVKRVAIQNFLSYKFGRNPVKQKGWDEFFVQLKDFEKKYNIKLIFDETDFMIQKTNKLPNPFKKKEILKLRLECLGKRKNEKLAFSKDRVISVITNKDVGQTVKVELVRVKHNIVVGKEI